MDYKHKAVDHLFKYLDARKGKLDIVYENSYQLIIDSIFEYLKINDRTDVTFHKVSEKTKEELFSILTNSEKFLCAYNPTWEKGFSNKLNVMVERAMELSYKAYQLSDMSAVFFEVFQACPFTIQELNKRLIRCFQTSHEMIVTDNNGSKIEVQLDDTYDWVNMDCFSEVDFNLSCNLPVGEVATYAPHVNGEIYFTGALLGTIPIGRNHGFINDPVYFKIEDNAITKIETDNQYLLEDLKTCLYFDDFTHLVNEIAVGTNYGVPTPLKGFNYKYEENQFGFHIGFGASLAQQNVQRLTPHHLDLVFEKSTVYLDGKLLFDGNYHLNNFEISNQDIPLRLAKKTCCTIHL